MYQVNLQSIIDKLPAIKNNSITGRSSHLKHYSGLLRKYMKYSRICAVCIIAALVTMGCEDSGSVGGALSPQDDNLEVKKVDVTNIEVLNEVGYSGRLNNSASGYIEDPFFGTIEAATFLKPSIDTNLLPEIDSNSNMRLQLVINPVLYGQDQRVNYNIYQAGEIWRGNQMSYNETVNVNTTMLVGSFSARGEDTLTVDLSSAWVDMYRNFFNSESADRDSLYRYNFPGLAIVPAAQNQRVHFFRQQTASSDTLDLGVTQFLVDNPADSLSGEIPVMDWGTSMTRSNQPDREKSFVLHNTFETILKMELDLDPADFTGEEIVNAQLMLFENDEYTNLIPSSFNRPAVRTMRAHAFVIEPDNIANDLFARTPALTATKDEDGIYKLNLTDLVLSHLFGESDIPALYFSIQTNNGILLSTEIYNQNGPADKTPRLVITTLKAED